MGKKKVFIVLAAVFALLIVGASALYAGLRDKLQTDQLATNPTQTAGESTSGEEMNYQMAPEFTVYDANGKACKLSDFRGKPAVINFWASWCGPCKSEMPEFQAAYEKYGDRISFLMVNMTDGMQETRASAEAFLAQSGYTFPVYFDEDISAATNYDVWSIPATYLLDAEGHLIAWASGALDMMSLETGITMILPEAE